MGTLIFTEIIHNKSTVFFLLVLITLKRQLNANYILRQNGFLFQRVCHTLFLKIIRKYIGGHFALSTRNLTGF